MKPSEKWKAINEEYGVERIRDRHKGRTITNNQEIAFNIPAPWALPDNRHKLLEVIHNFGFLWEREGLKEVPPALPEDSYGKKSVSLFLPAAEIDQLKADFKTIKQSFRRKGVVLSHLLSRLDVNAPVMPPKMELGSINLYPPELVEVAKRLAEIPLEEQHLHSAEFEAFLKACNEIYVSPRTLLQKCRLGKL